MYKLFSSESVTSGHPDKIADRISDSILDAVLLQDPESRVAIEACVSGNTVYVFGELTTKAKVDFEKVVRTSIKESGYDHKDYGFDYQSASYHEHIGLQSPDIALGVDSHNDKEQGAGDQGLMFGFAKDDTEELMPLAISLSHKITSRLEAVRKKGIIKGLRPDGKAQVTVAYDEQQVPKAVTAIVISTQHDETLTLESLKKQVIKEVIEYVIPQSLLNSETVYHINPTGRFVIGGPVGDSGLTGRKIIVDTYGGYARHGGGAFSGKDPSKVDRSAAYMARYLAKQIVASKIAKVCEIQIAYAIGVSKPVSLYVDTFGTGLVSNDIIYQTIIKHFDLTPNAIIKYLDLKKPIYTQTVNYGHFGRTGFSWEKLDKVEIFSNLLK